MNPTGITGTIPTKLQRYHHPSHPHKLFQNIIRNQKIFCDNLNCTRRIMHNEVSYVCFRCNFDLCSRCIELPTEPESQRPLHESDREINEDVHFFPSRYAKVVKSVRIHKVEEKNETVAHGPVIRPLTASQESSDEDDNDSEDSSEDSDANHLSQHETITLQPVTQQNHSSRQQETQLAQSSESNSTSQSQHQTPQQPRELVLTFHNENFDELTSERINTFINNSRGEIFIRNRTNQRATRDT